MDRSRVLTSPTFLALHNRNYRVYAAGNSVSLMGTTAQVVGQGWLVVNVLGRDGSALGFVYALNYLPLLLGAPYGGLVADRHDRRTILMVTQAVLGLCAVALFAAVAADAVEYWMVCAVSAAAGLVTVFDTPARHSIAAELVGRKDVANAISLNSLIMHTSRVIGPLIASLLIALVDVSACFAFNALSYLAIIAALSRLRVDELHRAPQAAREPGQIRAALRYVVARDELRSPLLVLAVVGTLTMNYTVLFPLLARDELGGHAYTLGVLTAAMSGGSMLGALYGASRARPSMHRLLSAGAGLGAVLALVSLAPTLLAAAPLLVIAGFAHIIYLNTTNSLLQGGADPEMRGRVMSFYSQLFLGSTPIGAPIVGWVIDRHGARAGVLFAAVAAMAATAAVGLRRSAR